MTTLSVLPGLEQFIDTPVKRYSSGMYVRLAFSVAAFLEPEILIIDEVLSVGDAQFQAQCMQRMEEIVTDGRTLIFVSHGAGLVQRVCRRAIFLQKGRIMFDGDTIVQWPLTRSPCNRMSSHTSKPQPASPPDRNKSLPVQCPTKIRVRIAEPIARLVDGRALSLKPSAPLKIAKDRFHWRVKMCRWKLRCAVNVMLN